MTEKTIMGEIKAINNLMRRYMEKNKPDGCSYGYFVCYLVHNQDREIYQKDIEKKFSIRPSTATQALNQLEKEGYIQRVTSSSDGRKKRIELTDKGRQLDKQAKAQVDMAEAGINKNLTHEEIEQFYAITQKIIDGLSELSK